MMSDEENVISWEVLKKIMQDIAEQRGDWAGYPVPVDNLKLNLAPSFPYPQLNGMTNSEEPKQNLHQIFQSLSEDEILKYTALLREESEYKYINSWYSYKYGYEVVIERNERTGKTRHSILTSTAGKRLTFALNSLGASQAWDIEPELRAMHTLSTLVREHTFKHYMLTGGFLETSKRSGVTYYFRKLRPTIAMKCDDQGTRILTVLCLHPIGYYSDSFAGCMVPTDDVIAHLQLMRGDEHKFWAKANHHNPHSPTSGI